MGPQVRHDILATKVGSLLFFGLTLEHGYNQSARAILPRGRAYPIIRGARPTFFAANNMKPESQVPALLSAIGGMVYNLLTQEILRE